jgi:hypothetical protein
LEKRGRLSLFLLQSSNDIQLYSPPLPTPTMGRSPCKKRGTTAEASAIIVVCEILTLSPIQDAEAEIAHFTSLEGASAPSSAWSRDPRRPHSGALESIAKTVIRPKYDYIYPGCFADARTGIFTAVECEGVSEVEKESWSNGPTNSWASLTHSTRVTVP